MTKDLAKKHALDARVEVTGSQRDLPDEVQLLLFLIAQKALSNIRRHARARVAEVKLEFGAGKIRLSTIDNGEGCDLTRSGKLGITGMYECARLLGGSLMIESESGKSTPVVADVPMAK